MLRHIRFDGVGYPKPLLPPTSDTMAAENNQYDPYIPAGGTPAAGGAHNAPGNQRTAALQAVSVPIP